MQKIKTILALSAMLGSATAYATQCNNATVEGTYVATTTGWRGSGSARAPFTAIALRKLAGGVVTPLYQVVVLDGAPTTPIAAYGSYQVSSVVGAKGTCVVVFTFEGGYQNTGFITDNGNHISVVGNGGNGVTASTEYVLVSH